MMKKIFFFLLIFCFLIVPVNAASIVCDYEAGLPGGIGSDDEDAPYGGASKYIKVKLTYDESKKKLKKEIYNADKKWEETNYTELTVFVVDDGSTYTGPYGKISISDSKFKTEYDNYGSKCPQLAIQEDASAAGYQISVTSGSCNQGSTICTKSNSDSNSGDSKDEGTKCIRSTSGDKLTSKTGFQFTFQTNGPGVPELCVKVEGGIGSPSCKKVATDSTSADYDAVNIGVDGKGGSYNFITIRGDQVSKFWSGLSGTTFTCPSNVYIVETDVQAKKYFITTDSSQNDEGTFSDTTQEGKLDEVKEGAKWKKPEVDLDINLDFGKGVCGALTKDMMDFLQWVLDVIRIAGITLAVVLGIMDYVKATASSKDDNIAAANKNFSKRLLSVAILFLAPTIITFVLQLLNIGTTAANPSCGLQ